MKKYRFKTCNYIILIVVVIFSVFICNTNTVQASSNEKFTYLSDINYISGTVGYGAVMKDTNIDGGIISLFVNGTEKKFIKGIGAHATSTIIYDLQSYNYDKFSAYLGMDASRKGSTNTDGGKFYILVSNDNINWTEKYASNKAYKPTMNAEYVSVDISGYRYLKLYCDKVGNNFEDHAVYANAKLSTKDYKEEADTITPFIKKVEEYDKIIKGYDIATDISTYELTLFQRTFVNNVGYDILQALCQYSKDYENTLKYLMENKEVLKLYLTGGKPEGTYASSIKILTDIYTKHNSDLNITTIDSKSKVPLGKVYEKMMITLSLTHSKKVHFWADSSQVSDPVIRYEIFKDLHENNLLDSDIFDKLNIINMRWVLNNLISDDQIKWLNNYVHEHKNDVNPYNYIRYTGGYNYQKPEYYSPENYDKWNNKYNLSKYNVAYETGHPKLWVVFEEGSVCGGLSKTGANMNTSLGIPALVVGQPGHAAYLVYGKDKDTGLGIWSIGNNIYGWAQSNWTYEGTMATGWGTAKGTSGFQASYVLLSQAALNDFENYEKAEALIYLAEVYKNDNDKLQQIYELALSKQSINFDAWLELVNTYKADSTKTEADYMELASKIANNLTYYPVPMWDLLKALDEKITTGNNIAKFTLLKESTLKKATTATKNDTIQPNDTKSLANYLLNKQDLSIASFSFDGENAGKIMLSSRFSDSTTRLKYSLDGGTNWKEINEKQAKLTNEEIDGISTTDGILVGLVGSNNNQKIEITKANEPNGIYNNDLENKVIGATDIMQWSFDKKIWNSFKTVKPNLSGDVTVYVRVGNSKTSIASNVVNLVYTKDDINPKQEYIPISRLSIHSVSSEQSGEEGLHVIDGNINTIWHTLWNGSDTKKEISIKLDKEEYLSALQYVPRKSSVNGIIKSGRVLTSIDGINWNETAKITNWSYTNVSKMVVFEKPVLASYIKILADETAGGFVSASMINLFKDTTIYEKAEINKTNGKFDLYKKSVNYTDLKFEIVKNAENINTVKVNGKNYNLLNSIDKEALKNILSITESKEKYNIKIPISWLSTLKESKNSIEFVTDKNNTLSYNFNVVDTTILTDELNSKNDLGSAILSEKVDSTYILEIQKNNIDEASLADFKIYIDDKKVIGNFDISIYNESVKINYDKSITITLKLGKEYALKDITILHKKNEKIEKYTSIADNNGNVTFTSITGLSQFVIITNIEKQPDTPNIDDSDNKPNKPDNGNNDNTNENDNKPSKPDNGNNNNINNNTNIKPDTIVLVRDEKEQSNEDVIPEVHENEVVENGNEVSGEVNSKKEVNNFHIYITTTVLIFAIIISLIVFLYRHYNKFN